MNPYRTADPATPHEQYILNATLSQYLEGTIITQKLTLHQEKDCASHSWEVYQDSNNLVNILLTKLSRQFIITIYCRQWPF